MDKIQTAEEFAWAIRGIREHDPITIGAYETKQTDYSYVTQNGAIALIRSRDRAIVERCKQKIMHENERCRRGISDTMNPLACLDSVLRELEGEEVKHG